MARAEPGPGAGDNAALRLAARPCLQCASCIARCPPCAGTETVNMRRLIRLLQLDMVDEALRSESLWACALCQACAQSCPSGAEPYKIVALLREAAFARGLVPQSVSYFVENTIRRGSPFPLSQREVTAWATGLALPRQGETIFYAGLYPYMAVAEKVLARAAALDPGSLTTLNRGLIWLQRLGLDGAALRFLPRVGLDVYQASLRAAVGTLAKLDVPVAYLYEAEPWCGLELHTYGLRAQFTAHARRVHDQLRRLGVREIITADTLALTTFRRFFPEVIPDFDIAARHLIEVLSARLSRGSSWGSVEAETVVYNDPCYLARYLGMIEEPREVIRRLGRYRILEAEESGMATRCDGGGGLEVVYPRLALELAKARATQLIATGANKIVTPCPVCVMMLRAGAAALGSAVPVVDLTDLVGEALGSGGIAS